MFLVLICIHPCHIFSSSPVIPATVWLLWLIYSFNCSFQKLTWIRHYSSPFHQKLYFRTTLPVKSMKFHWFCGTMTQWVCPLGWLRLSWVYEKGLNKMRLCRILDKLFNWIDLGKEMKTCPLTVKLMKIRLRWFVCCCMLSPRAVPNVNLQHVN